LVISRDCLLAIWNLSDLRAGARICCSWAWWKRWC